MHINDDEKDIIIYPRIERRVSFSLADSLPEDKNEVNESHFIKNIDTIYLGKFELKDGMSITSLNFKYDTTATITYVANLEETESKENTIKNYYYYKKIGQLYGTLP